MDRDPVVDAGDVVRRCFPHARWAVLAGSVLTEHRTAGSDLDIVVVDDTCPDVPYRRSLHWRGWPVELFVHNDHSLEHYLAKDLAARRPALPRMVADGVVVSGSGVDTAAVQDRCARLLADGPPPLPTGELDFARYRLTDLLDDLTHSVDAGESAVVTAVTWLAIAELACDLARHWRGTGKWLLRELRDLDAGFAQRWLSGHGDPAAVAVLGAEVLRAAGGPLFDGFRQSGRLPRPGDVARESATKP